MVTEDLNTDIDHLCSRAFYGCKRKHQIYIEKVVMINVANVKNYIGKDGNVYRFLLRDAVENNTLQCFSTVWNGESLIDGTIDEGQGNCEECFSSILSKPLTAESLDIQTEWYKEFPLNIQVLLESFINKRSLTQNTDPEALRKKKLEKLFMIYDTLLNILNRNFVGVFQRANSKRLLVEYKSIGSVFEITSSAGATLSLNQTEIELKSSANVDMCYYNTYLKDHKLLYTSLNGESKDLSRIRDCHLILMLDNLVRLKYVADPNPGEHRSKQICTLPITLQGLPLDSIATAGWHSSECDGSDYCPCKNPVRLTETDIPQTLLEPAGKEKELRQQFFVLMTSGYTKLWKELPDELLDYVGGGTTTNVLPTEEMHDEEDTCQLEHNDNSEIFDESESTELDVSLTEVLQTASAVSESLELSMYLESDQESGDELEPVSELEISMQNISITEKDEIHVQQSLSYREVLKSFGLQKKLCSTPSDSASRTSSWA